MNDYGTWAECQAIWGRIWRYGMNMPGDMGYGDMGYGDMGGMPGDMGGGYGTPPSDEFGNPMDDPYGPPTDYDFGGFGPVDEPEFTAFDFPISGGHNQEEDEAVAFADISSNIVSWTINDPDSGQIEIYDNEGVSLRTKPMDQGMSDPWGPSNEDRSFVYIVDPSNADTVPLKLKDDWGGALQNESYDDFSREYIAVTSDSDGYKLLMKESFFDYWSGDQKEEYRTLKANSQGIVNWNSEQWNVRRSGRRRKIWSGFRW